MSAVGLGTVHLRACRTSVGVEDVRDTQLETQESKKKSRGGEGRVVGLRVSGAQLGSCQVLSANRRSSPTRLSLSRRNCQDNFWAIFRMRDSCEKKESLGMGKGT